MKQAPVQGRLQGRLLSIFLGSMLGDGHLRPGRNASYTEAHAVDQEEYLRWKMGFWGDLVSSSGHSKARKETHQDSFSFSTGVLPELNYWRVAFYDRHYPEGRPGRRSKHFPEEVVPLMTPLALAVWFMDDGGAAHYPFLSCHLRSVDVGQRILAEFGLESRVKGVSGSTRIDVLDAERFLALIKPHIHPTLEYKLHPTCLGTRDKIPSEEFLLLVKEENYSVSQLAEHFRVADRTIKEKAHHLRVRVRGLSSVAPDLHHLVERVDREGHGGRRVVRLPKSTLEELLMSGHSMRRLALRFGVSEAVVRRELDRLEIPYDPKGKRGGCKPGYHHITREVLAEACKTASSITDLQRKLGIGRYAVTSRMKRWGLKLG